MGPLRACSRMPESASSPMYAPPATPGQTTLASSWWYADAKEQLVMMDSTPVWKADFGKSMTTTQACYRIATCPAKAQRPKLRPMLRAPPRPRPAPRPAPPPASGPAADAAAAAGASARAAGGCVKAADLAALADLDAPSEALAMVGASLLCLVDDDIPSDARWPTYVARVDADASTLREAMLAFDPAACPAFKRAAIRTFLDSAAEELHWKALPAKAAGPCKKVDGWVRAALAAADAAAAAEDARDGDGTGRSRAEDAAAAAAAGARRARGRIARRKKAQAAAESPREEIVVSVIREDLGPDPTNPNGPNSPWLITVISRKGRGGGGFVAKAYHPATSFECAVKVPDIEACQTPLPPLQWAAEVLPSTLEMYVIAEQPRLRLGAKLGPTPAKRRSSVFSMIDNYNKE
jgi:hypothetical protein